MTITNNNNNSKNDSVTYDDEFNTADNGLVNEENDSQDDIKIDMYEEFQGEIESLMKAEQHNFYESCFVLKQKEVCQLKDNELK